MAVETRYEHIVLNEDGVPMIAETLIKVEEVVADYLYYGWSADEIFAQHEPYLTRGQIHSALAYYWDHKAEIDADMERRRQYVEALRASAPPNPFVERLRAIKYGDAG